MKKIHRISVLWMCALIVFGSSSLAQSKVTDADVLAHLEATKQLSCEILSSEDLSSVSSALLYKGSVQFHLDRNSLHDDSEGTIFMKDGQALLPFSNFVDVLTSEHFIRSIKDDFKLDNVSAAEKFQSMLSVFDNKPYAKGFFQSEDNWYFIRSEFFDDIEHYKVVTDGEGRITAITYNHSLDVDMPDQLSKAGNRPGKKANDCHIIDEKDSLQIVDYLNGQVKYRFEVVEKFDEHFQKVSDAQLFNGMLILTESEEGMNYEVSRPVIVMAYAGNLIHLTSERALLKDELFIRSLKKYVVKSSDDAKVLADALATIHPTELGDQIAAEPRVEDDIWLLTWEKDDEEDAGYLVKVNEKGWVEYIDYSVFNETSILKMRMKDPDYKVSYDFALTTPVNSKVDLKKGDSLPVSIQFNAMAANARGAWILTRFNGKKVGMRAGTSIESPFNDEVPDKVLTKGNHVLEYLLLPNGKSTDNPLGIVKIEINVN